MRPVSAIGREESSTWARATPVDRRAATPALGPPGLPRGALASRSMRREPPAAVRRQLAEEVGFGCPVEGCGSPYLTWHHFDPPWAEPAASRAGWDGRSVPRPSSGGGCWGFHEGGAPALQGRGRDRSQVLGATFNWMRESLLAVVGGNLYYETPIALRMGDSPIVWFNRDPSGRLLVNLQMVTTSGEPRLVMLDNFWMAEGRESDIQCPPSGRLRSSEISERRSTQDRVPRNRRNRRVGSPRSSPRSPAAVRERFAERGIPLDDTPRRTRILWPGPGSVFLSQSSRSR